MARDQKAQRMGEVHHTDHIARLALMYSAPNSKERRPRQYLNLEHSGSDINDYTPYLLTVSFYACLVYASFSILSY